MIINLWSTPRTGSVWYSHYLQSQYQNSLLITEMFNRYHMNMYHVRGDDGTIRNYHEYVPNGFYKEYYIGGNGLLDRRSIYSARVRTIEQEEDYCFDILKKAPDNQVLILHNHIDPINTLIRDFLIDRAAKNIWIYREDKRQQLASYAVALSTKKFAAFKKPTINDDQVMDIEKGPLENLIRRIRVWDTFHKNDMIAFEDIAFFDKDGFPFDQNTDPWKKLTENMKSIIEELVSEYENNTNK